MLQTLTDFSDGDFRLWDDLAAAEPAPDPLSCGSAWQTTALRCSSWRASPILFRQEAKSQAAFVLLLTGDVGRLMPLEAHWSFGCPVIGPDGVELLADAIGEARTLLKLRVVEAKVSGVDPGSSLMKRLRAAFCETWVEPQDAHAAGSLEGGFEGWLGRRSPGFRRNLRRAGARAGAAGMWFERVEPRTAAEADAVFDRMLALERRSWKGPVGHGLLALPMFYRRLLRAYATAGVARVVLARFGEEEAGFCFGGFFGGVFRGQQTSYRDDLAAFSLGSLMHAETARWISADGGALHHFGPIQRRMSYKRAFCERILESASVRISVG